MVAIAWCSGKVVRRTARFPRTRLRAGRAGRRCTRRQHAHEGGPVHVSFHPHRRCGLVGDLVLMHDLASCGAARTRVRSSS